MLNYNQNINFEEVTKPKILEHTPVELTKNVFIKNSKAYFMKMQRVNLSSNTTSLNPKQNREIDVSMFLRRAVESLKSILRGAGKLENSQTFLIQQFPYNNCCTNLFT